MLYKMTIAQLKQFSIDHGISRGKKKHGKKNNMWTQFGITAIQVQIILMNRKLQVAQENEAIYPRWLEGGGLKGRTHHGRHQW